MIPTKSPNKVSSVSSRSLRGFFEGTEEAEETMSVGECRFCRAVRPMSELTAVIPLLHPAARFHVCRASLSERACFRWVVGPASSFSIEPACEMRAAA